MKLHFHQYLSFCIYFFFCQIFQISSSCHAVVALEIQKYFIPHDADLCVQKLPV